MTPFLSPWRAQSAGGVTRIAPAEPFDEVVVGDWLHVEVTDRNRVWVGLAHLNINVQRRADGVLLVDINADGEDVPAIVTLRDPIAGLAHREKRRQFVLDAYGRARDDESEAPTPERLREELRRVGWGS